MTKIELGVIEALSTILFQEGFDRKCGKHGLEYWNVEEKDLHVHCRQCNIYEGQNERYQLNTTKIDESWYVRLFCMTSYDEDEYYACDDECDFGIDVSTLLLVPVNPEKLCWEIGRYANLIHTVIVDRMNLE